MNRDRRKTSHRRDFVSYPHMLMINGEWALRNFVCEHYDWTAWAQAVQTKNERSQACLLTVDDEAREHGVSPRAKRNHANIPSNWDDKSVAAWDTRKSWKHYSKRQKQWIGR
ncbi:hypothetical protein [Azospirillum sp.]|uniref:hypothetical protein n=1 Tax=Azospirillum sp. TaxID=34012 RepID=UPI0026067D8B|nr:hypothetical protein [Azospirillum sp.]